MQFLLAGGAQVFSADCVAAFLECNINPESIGSYGALMDRQEAARQRVGGHDAMVRSGQRPPGLPPGPQENGPDVPSFADRWAANSTAGHIGQDASHRRAPSARGDNCATIVDGYTERGAPAMVTSGNSTTPGTVEYDVSQREQALAAQRRAQSGGSTAYPEDQRRADRNEIARTAVTSHANNFPRGLNNVPVAADDFSGSAGQARLENDRRAAVNRARGEAAGSTAAIGPVGTPGSAATTTAADPNSVPLVDSKNKSAPATDRAAECLQAFCDACETPQARLEAINQEVARQQARQWGTAEQAAHATEDQRLQGNAAAAQQRAADARAQREAAEDAATTPPNPRLPPDQQARLDRRRREAYDEAVRAEQAAAANAQEQQRLLEQHQQSTPAEQIRCLNEQRAGINADNPRTTGTIPSA